MSAPTGINLFLLQKNRELRQHARGADIALLHDGCDWVALMDDAALCRKSAGTLGVWKDLGDGAQQMSFGDRALHHTLEWLSKHHSVALMERVVSPPGQFWPSFCCLWVVQRSDSSAWSQAVNSEALDALEELARQFEAEIDSEYCGCEGETIEEKLRPAVRARQVLAKFRPLAATEPDYSSMLD